MAGAHPDTMGYYLTEEHSLAGAIQAAERDAWSDAYGAERSVPADFPAVGATRFFWPISNGTTQAALVVVRDGEHTLARVIGMCRHNDGPPEPGVYAEVDITAIPARSDKPGADNA